MISRFRTRVASATTGTIRRSDHPVAPPPPQTSRAGGELCSVPPVHIVIMGCGRVGASLAHNLVRLEHSIAIIDQDPLAFRRLGDNFSALQVKGVGFDRETLIAAGHRAGRRLRRGEQRRQLQHHRRARRAGDVRRAEGRGPDLRPEARRGLRATRHPHRRHRAVDGRPAAEDRPRRSHRGGLARPVGRRQPRPRHPGRRLGRAHDQRVRDRDRRPRRHDHAVRRWASCRSPSTVIQAGDTLHVLVTDAHAARAARPGRPVAGRGQLHEGRHRRSRRGRALDRPRAVAERSPRAAHRQGPGEGRAGSHPRRRMAARRRLRGRQPGEREARGIRRRHRRHRRRQGQPRHGPARQDRVLGTSRGGPDQSPRQRVAVHRGVGRRRRGVDAAGASPHSSRRPSRSATSCGCSACARGRRTCSRSPCPTRRRAPAGRCAN